MSMLSTYRSQLKREIKAETSDQRNAAAAETKVVAKERELGRTSSASRQRTLRSQIADLKKKRSNAETSAAKRSVKVAELREKVAKEESKEAKKQRKLDEKRQLEGGRRLGETKQAIDELDALMWSGDLTPGRSE